MSAPWQLVLAALLVGASAPLPRRACIVHLFEWTFPDIALECERFLGPRGFAAVQTSPVNEHLSLPEGPWWERYQPVSYRINSRSGNETAFADMVRRCQKAGVRVYVDVVLNHMTGPNKDVLGTAGSTADGVLRKYPGVPYGENNFHPPCDILSYQDANQVRNCRLSGLNDLDHQDNFVRVTIIKFLNQLLDLGVAGFRVDAAKHMWPTDLKYIFDEMKNLSTLHGHPAGTRPFIYQEVIDLGGEGVKKEEYTGMGRVTEFKYGLELGKAFRGKTALKWLVDIGPKWGLLPSNDALVFVDNHDNQRGHGAGGADILTYKNRKEYEMATAFVLAWPYGLPRVISSYGFADANAGPPRSASGAAREVVVQADGACGNGWVCEHRWRAIANMAAFRAAVEGTEVRNWWDNGNKQIAFSRGTKGFIAFNGESDTVLQQTLQTGLPKGAYCDVLAGDASDGGCTGAVVVVADDGRANINVAARSPLAIHVEAKVPQ